MAVVVTRRRSSRVSHHTTDASSPATETATRSRRRDAVSLRMSRAELRLSSIRASPTYDGCCRRYQLTASSSISASAPTRSTRARAASLSARTARWTCEWTRRALYIYIYIYIYSLKPCLTQPSFFHACPHVRMLALILHTRHDLSPQLPGKASLIPSFPIFVFSFSVSPPVPLCPILCPMCVPTCPIVSPDPSHAHAFLSPTLAGRELLGAGCGREWAACRDDTQRVE